MKKHGVINIYISALPIECNIRHYRLTKYTWWLVRVLREREGKERKKKRSFQSAFCSGSITRYHYSCNKKLRYFLPCPVLQPFDRRNFGKVVEVECSTSSPLPPRDSGKHNPVGHTALGSGNLLLNYCFFFCRCWVNSLLHHLTCVLHSTLKLHILLFSLLPQKPFAFAPDLWKNWSICYYSGYWSSPQGLLCNIHFNPMIKSKNLRPVLFAYSRATLSLSRWKVCSFPLFLMIPRMTPTDCIPTSIWLFVRSRSVQRWNTSSFPMTICLYSFLLLPVTTLSSDGSLTDDL